MHIYISLPRYYLVGIQALTGFLVLQPRYLYGQTLPLGHVLDIDIFDQRHKAIPAASILCADP